MTADYPLIFTDCVISDFQKGKDHVGESFVIPLDL